MNQATLILALIGLLPLANLRAEAPGLPPINSLAIGKYQGFTGGLYAEGKNEPDKHHAAALTIMTAAIEPLDFAGKPDPKGKVVVVGIGASVCRQVFAALEDLAPKTPGLAPSVFFVNCAKGGHDVNKLADPRYWLDAKAELTRRGLSPAQVQVAWYQSDDLRDSRDDFPGRPERLKESIAGNLRLLKEHFPHLRLCYHSGRHTTAFSPAQADKVKHREPRPWMCGWAIKWLIEEQSAGRKEFRFAGPDAPLPLNTWAGYFWTDGDQKRHDGYQWTREDVVADGVHLSEKGKPRVARELIDFWKQDPYARTWFTAEGGKKASTQVAGVQLSEGKAGGLPEPAWIINGQNKLPKLKRLVGDNDFVRVLVRNLKGDQVAEIRDVLHLNTDLNRLVGPGEYRLEFFDRQGKRIKLTLEVGEVLKLK